MVVINVLAYIADFCIIGSYFLMVRRPSLSKLFHWANAVGSVPLILVEGFTGAWAVMPLTIAFGCIGWYGVFKNDS